MPRIKKSENIQKIEEPKIEIEHIVDDDSSGSSEVIEKPKKVLSEKQKEAFEKARLKRQENIQTRKMLKEKEDKEFQKLKDEKQNKKVLKEQKKKDLELKKIELDNPSDSEESVIVVKKKKSKKKVIYVDDDEEQKDNNIVIINKMESQKLPPKMRPQPMGRFI